LAWVAGPNDAGRASRSWGFARITMSSLREARCPRVPESARCCGRRWKLTEQDRYRALEPGDEYEDTFLAQQPRRAQVNARRQRLDEQCQNGPRAR
jgi:hypothetical protein